MKKILIFGITLCFSFFIVSPYAYGMSKKLYSIPLFGLSILCGYGANYLYHKSLDKYDEAENKYNEYLSLPDGTSNDIFETKYEEYEDQYAEFKKMQTYYYMALGATILSFGASIYFVLSKDKNSTTALGYRYNYFASRNDIYLIMKF